jgi:phosphoribosyl-AMP cyclohydrolase
MFAWMNAESLDLSLKLGETVFYSRSRSELWHKGATSGNTQKIVGIEVDCDQDVLLFEVIAAGPACHTGSESCFDNGVLGREE